MNINIDEIKKALTVKGITIPTDDELYDLIDYNLLRIISLTGLDLDIKTYHYTITDKKYVEKIVLPLHDIFDVDEVHVDFELLDDGKYFVDNRNGVIFFKEPLGRVRHMHIKYLVKPDDSLASSILTPLVADMIINDNEKGDNGTGITGEVSSIHEGNTSISFKASTSLQDSIDKRLEKLANGEISLNGKPKKGAYYL